MILAKYQSISAVFVRSSGAVHFLKINMKNWPKFSYVPTFTFYDASRHRKCNIFMKHDVHCLHWKKYMLFDTLVTRIWSKLSDLSEEQWHSCTLNNLFDSNWKLKQFAVNSSTCFEFSHIDWFDQAEYLCEE